MLLSRRQDAGQNHNAANKSFEYVAEFRCMRTTVTNHNLIYEEINSRLNSGKACHRSVQNLFSSSLLSKTVNFKLHRIIILPVVFYGWEKWTLILRKEHGLKIFEKRVLRRIFGPKRDEIREGWRKTHYKGLLNLYSSPNIILIINSRRIR
jgi:hypothetical protein